MEVTEEVIAYGHELIRSTHRTTLEITREMELAERGDCIVAVRSNKACADLRRDFIKAARRSDAEITMILQADEVMDTVKAIGDPGLSFTHPTDIVVRRSQYVCNRTLAVKADKAAADLPRSLVKKLRNPNQKIRITLTVRVPDEAGERCVS